MQPTIRGEAAVTGINVEPIAIHELVSAYGLQTEEVSR